METFLGRGPRRFALVSWSALVLLPFISICYGAPVPALPTVAPAVTAAPTQDGLVPSRESSPAASITPSASVENSVVKIFSTIARPDLYRPWSKESPAEFSGSGAIISGNRILTNAHMVLHASQIQIQANQSGDKISATVEAVAPGIDLAVLKLDDAKFFDSHPPIHQRKTLPDVKEPVLVYGYPTGGSSLSITKGIISRIEFTSYSLSVQGLRIQIDAAINPGNSGGPAMVGDEMIGLAFSHLAGAQNIGYIIPCEEIELFLQDIADGHYDGKPTMYDDLQTLENPALRTFLKLDPSVRGEIVHKPFSSDANYPLKEWDVITRIGDTPVDDQGMIKVSDNLRVRFPYLIQKVAKGDKVPLTVVRASKEMKIELPLLKRRPLVLPELEGAYPSYFIYGPMVFSEATTDLLGGLGQQGRQAPQATSFLSALSLLGSPLVTRIGDKPAFEGERLVVVPSPFFPHKLATGYGSPAWQVVKTINRQPIKNLAHLVGVLRDLKDNFVSVEFNTRTGSETMVFPRAEMATSTETILNDNGIRSQGSPEIMKIWNSNATH
jgi:S1-C subfamily serine protease